MTIRPTISARCVARLNRLLSTEEKRAFDWYSVAVPAATGLGAYILASLLHKDWKSKKSLLAGLLGVLTGLGAYKWFVSEFPLEHKEQKEEGKSEDDKSEKTN